MRLCLRQCTIHSISYIFFHCWSWCIANIRNIKSIRLYPLLHWSAFALFESYYNPLPPISVFAWPCIILLIHLLALIFRKIFAVDHWNCFEGGVWFSWRGVIEAVAFDWVWLHDISHYFLHSTNFFSSLWYFLLNVGILDDFFNWSTCLRYLIRAQVRVISGVGKVIMTI